MLHHRKEMIYVRGKKCNRSVTVCYVKSNPPHTKQRGRDLVMDKSQDLSMVIERIEGEHE